MLTRENKIGLVLAFLLALSDIAFLVSLTGDSADKPPIAVVVLSVVVGIVSLVLIGGAWRRPTRPVMLTIIGLRLLSALGDVPGFFQTAGIVTASVIHFVITLVCVGLLRNWLQRSAETTPRAGAGAVR